MAVFLPLAEAVAANIKDGDTVAFEGFTHLIPFAAVHETIRQKRRDLHLVRMTPDLIYDQLIGMGCVRKLTFSWGGNPGVGSLHRLRDAIENDWPRPLEVDEHSHAALANAYEAGAAGLPFAMFRGYRGTQHAAANPKNIKSITCPFTGEVLAAVPSVRADCAVIHALKADRKGNVFLEGIVGVQKEAVLGAKRAIVTVEEVVDDFGAGPNACILPSWTVSAIAVVPGGAHPSYAHGYYKRDNAYYKAWEDIGRERDVFLKWMEENVMRQGAEVFERHAGKGARS
jgi:glutaconate CoA-transferase subunit A